MVALDDSGFTAKTGFYNIRVNSSLRQEVYRTDLLCFFLKDADKFFTNDFALMLRLGNSCQFAIVTILCIDTDKVKIEVSCRSKYLLNLVAFVFTKKSVIYKYTSKLFTDCLGEQTCCHRRVYTTGQCQKHFAIANFFADQLDLLLYEGVHTPSTRTAANTTYKVVQHFCSLLCMKHFRMELDRIKITCCILSCRYRAVCCMCNDFKTWSNF